MGLEDSNLELLMVLGMGKWFQEEELSTFFNSYLEGGGVAIITPSEIFSETASIIREMEWLRFLLYGLLVVRPAFEIHLESQPWSKNRNWLRFFLAKRVGIFT